MKAGNLRPRTLALAAGLMILMATAAFAEDATTDKGDQDTLERALFLCQWKLDHDVPDNAPNPAVCRSGAVSTDDAMLQLKQWWTFWARLDPAMALKANQQFSADYAAFQSRLTLKPELAEQLLPQGITLQKSDWRVKLIRELIRRYGKPAPSKDSSFPPGTPDTVGGANPEGPAGHRLAGAAGSAHGTHLAAAAAAAEELITAVRL